MSGGWGGRPKADRLILKWTPTNSTPDATEAGVPREDMLAAVLAGLDNAVSPGADGLSGVRSLWIQSTSFSYDGANDVSTYTLPASASTSSEFSQFRLLAKSGVLVMRDVGTETPSEDGDFGISGAVLSIFGDVTTDADWYFVQYGVA